MSTDGSGYWSVEANEIEHLTTYKYIVDNVKSLPDPASNYQPEGIYGPSAVYDHGRFDWEDRQWTGIAIRDLVLYELHTGTFTPEGTFDAAIDKLDDLIDTGINAISLMPVSQFPGERNWGYDGVYPFAVQNSYGGPDGLKRFVNACHIRGMAVILDVVYNHLGPEGNYIRDYAPYFTPVYKTLWGDAINFDGAYSDEVRNYFCENTLYWLEKYHIDGVRLDAIHGIYDHSPHPFLLELSEKVADFSKNNKPGRIIIAECDLNDAKVLKPPDLGGYGFDGQWNDDFHHSLHTVLTGEKEGYYQDFGELDQLAKAVLEGFFFSWTYSQFRKKHHGSSSREIPTEKFILFSQNHDQVGNRMFGERLDTLISFEASKLAAGVLMLTPGTPMLFMGQEYNEDNPFQYFISHTDEQLVSSVREGRKKEFSEFHSGGEPPDPQSPETFNRSKLEWDKRTREPHSKMLELYKFLIRLRKEIPALYGRDKDAVNISIDEERKILLMQRWSGENRIFCVMNFDKTEHTIIKKDLTGTWKLIIDSSDKIWGGPGMASCEKMEQDSRLVLRPESFVLYELENR